MLPLAQALVKSRSGRVFEVNVRRRDYRFGLVYHRLAGGAMHRTRRKHGHTCIQTPIIVRDTNHLADSRLLTLRHTNNLTDNILLSVNLR